MAEKKRSTVTYPKVFSLTAAERDMLASVAKAEDRSLIAVVRRALAAYYARNHKGLVDNERI